MPYESYGHNQLQEEKKTFDVAPVGQSVHFVEVEWESLSHLLTICTDFSLNLTSYVLVYVVHRTWHSLLCRQHRL